MFGEKNNNNISSLVRQCTVVVYIPCTTGQCFLLFTKQKGMIGVYDIFTRGRGEVPISLVLCVCFVDRCFSFRSLCCLFFFDFSLRILINPLISSSFTIFPVNLKICHDKGYSFPETPHKRYNKLLHIV